MCNPNFDSQFAERVALLCYEQFEKLPKSGKPVQNQWTYLAAIVKHYDGKLEVVSMGTGSKCIGRSKLSPSGDIINDSHAEVLARRGFLKYLYEHIESVKSGRPSDILTFSDCEKSYRLLQSVTFHLFSSHVPCGDAAIFPNGKLLDMNPQTTAAVALNLSSADERDYPAFKKRKIDSFSPSSSEIGNIIEDINRTGAKCLAGEKHVDQKLAGVGYHVVGCVRTKPGRGDPTLSVSCSDKILRWNCVGIQGALLSLLLDRIYLSSIIIGNENSLYSEEALKRAVIDRNAEVAKMNRHPVLLHSSLEFKFCKRLSRISGRPSPCGIVWTNVPFNNHEVVVEGRRLGWTKKSQSAELLSITKKVFFNTFKSVNENSLDDCTYYEVKQTATAYQDSWRKVKAALNIWTEKNIDLLQFK